MIVGTPKIVAIVNLTEDSFSDGGSYLEPEAALRHARALVHAGADLIELGPSSSHPDSKPVEPAEEIRRLEAVLPTLRAEGIATAVDSFHEATQRFALESGARMLNDTRGFPTPSMHKALAATDCTAVIMHSVQRDGRADRSDTDPRETFTGALDFFAERVGTLEAAGVARERMVLDPGMGLFLGAAPEASVYMLQRLTLLREAFNLPVLVSVSRKSFLGAITGRDTADRGAATLAAELYAAGHGVDYIRTHDAAALRDALKVFGALGERGGPG